MSGNNGAATAKPQEVVTPREIDFQVNALLRAITEALGRKPFSAGCRNVRSVIRTWCPLAQDSKSEGPFHGSYVAAHFLDRYFYSSELGGTAALEDQAFELFEENLVRGREFKVPSPFSWLGAVLASASRMIGAILGPFEQEELFESSHHGPKGAVGVLSREAFLDKKVLTLTGTPDVLLLYRDYLGWNSNLDSLLLDEVKLIEAACGVPEQVAFSALAPVACVGNKLSFVPKSYCKLRTMMVEPVLNQFFQLGLGNMITRRLKRSCNIDLATQPDCHRHLCRVITSHDLPIATLDWSQASDRIWLKLVEHLLPPDWFNAICTIRSPQTSYRGRVMPLTMVGSMGNGFTFPLQTLVFYTLLLAIHREADDTPDRQGIFPDDCFVTVFGDDCIVDSKIVPDVEKLAAGLGWKLNMDKSFWSGPFRESCGMDAYAGVNVRPFFIERPSLDDLQSRLRLQGWAYGCFNQAVVACHVEPTCQPLVDWLESTLELLGADSCFLVPPRWGVRSGVQTKDPAIQLGFKRLSVSKVPGSEFLGYAFKCLAVKPKKKAVSDWPYYLNSLRGLESPVAAFTKKPHYGDTDDQPILIPDNGWVPDHTFTVKKREYQVLTWRYWLDPL